MISLHKLFEYSKKKQKSIKISETRREKKSEIRKMNKVLSFAIIILMLVSQQVWIINS